MTSKGERSSNLMDHTDSSMAESTVMSEKQPQNKYGTGGQPERRAGRREAIAEQKAAAEEALKLADAGSQKNIGRTKKVQPGVMPGQVQP